MASPLIRLENVGVIHNEGKPNEIHSLRNVNVRIYPEEFIIFFGPSGCGKSTVLYNIAGLMTPTYGKVFVGGQNLAEMNGYQKSKFRLFQIGMVFQSFYLISTLSILDNVSLPKLFNGEDVALRNQKGMELLDRFGISEQALKYPSELSGGQKQRVAISRSLVNDPEIILADEPVGNLDSESAKNVIQILKDLNEMYKKTVILVTHNADHLGYADRVINLRDGQIIGEEVNKEKRPDEAVRVEAQKALEEIKKMPPDLRTLMRTFQGLSDVQTNVLLVPFKAKQFVSHVLTALSNKQVEMGERYVKEFLFGNVTPDDLMDHLDAPYEKDGAGWNRLRAKSFVQRLQSTMQCVNALSKGEPNAIGILADHVVGLYELRLSEQERIRFESILRMRVANRIGKEDLLEWLDFPTSKGGVNLRKDVAERVAQEVEIIMLLKYS